MSGASDVVSRVVSSEIKFGIACEQRAGLEARRYKCCGARLLFSATSKAEIILRELAA